MNTVVPQIKKLTIDIQKLKRKEHSLLLKKVHQTTREETKEEKNRTTKTARKQVIKWQ